MFGDNPSPETPPNGRKGFFMWDKTAVSSMSDDEITSALSLLSAESERRERERSRFEKARLSKRNKRDPRCPECKVSLMADGRRHDGVARYECPKCGRHFSDSSSTSLSSSKLTPGRIRAILTLITMDCPDWVVAEIAGVNEKTAQFWVDRCLDAASEWSNASKLSGRVWIDELYVLPAFRGRGIGGSFFCWLHENIPAARYRLETEPENERARNLYARYGYKEFPYLQMVKETPSFQ